MSNVKFASLIKPMRKTSTVIVEGNIGSGKSTFLNFCKNFSGPQINLVAEPLDCWRDFHGVNIFDLFYKDPKRWGFTFQTYADLTRFQLHKRAKTDLSDGVKLMERSLFSARHCFIENMRQSNLVNSAEYTILSQWFEFLESIGELDYDLIVYLRTKPETCYQRIQQRNREEECPVTLEYLSGLHENYEKWVSTVPPEKLLTINADLSQSDLEPFYKHCCENIFENKRFTNVSNE